MEVDQYVLSPNGVVWKPMSWVSEVAPRIGLAALVVGAVTIERTASQVVNTSGGRLPPISIATSLQILRRTISKQTSVVYLQYTGTREMRLALDQVVSPALSVMIACGVMGVPFSSLQYNWAIQDTYRHFNINPPDIPGITGFLRQKMAPGLPWAFLRASCGTGGGLYFGPFVAEHIAHVAQDSEVVMPSRLPNFLGGLVTGACGSLATQWVHNVTLVAGRMAALGSKKQAPHYTTVAFGVAWKEMGVGLFWANFPQRMVINAVTVAVLNLCDIFYRPDISGWR